MHGKHLKYTEGFRKYLLVYTPLCLGEGVFTFFMNIFTSTFRIWTWRQWGPPNLDQQTRR